MSQTSQGWMLSVALHVMLAIVVVWKLPSLFDKKITHTPKVITVKVLPISEFTNIKQIVKTKPKKKPKKDKPKKEVVKKKPKPALPEPKPKKLAEAKVDKPVAKPIEKPKKAPVPIKKEKPKEKTKPKPKTEQPETDSFASVLKSIEELEDIIEEEKEEEQFQEVTETVAITSEPTYRPGLPLSLSEKDAIRQQIVKNWTVLAGAKDVQGIVVTLVISMNVDGGVTDVQIEEASRMGVDRYFRAVAESAVRAVYKSSPLKNLPKEKYDVKDGWRKVKLNFDPSEIVY